MTTASSWRLAAELSDEAWDAELLKRPGADAFQSAAWALHKADFGWRPVRALADGAAVQALVKDLPGGARVLWARGGPVGEPARWSRELRELLLSAAGGRAVYGRLCSYREAAPADARALWQAGWARPDRPLDKPLTYALDLAPEPEALKEALSSNWGHNERRGHKRLGGALDWTDPDADEMEKLYREMETYKSIPPQHRAPALRSLAKALGPRLILKRVVHEGRTIGLRGCAVFGERAVDLLAATNADGRKLYASYVLLLSLIYAARRAGAKVYDLGGADPDAAKGVADFKKGTGARLVETLGEWDFASPDALRGPAGSLVSWRLGRGA